MDDKDLTLLELASQIEARHHLMITHIPSDPDQYIREVFGVLADRYKNQLEVAQFDYESIGDLTQALKKETSDRQISEKIMRDRYQDLLDDREACLLRIEKHLHLIMDQSVTHGQKNGMILLVAAIARQMAYSTPGSDDFSF